ncbi:MAG: hypothetical protein ACREXR_20100 [Gammaproteobacteria bacterium]
MSEQRLEEYEARERGQLAVLKTQCGQAMGLAVDFGLLYFMGSGLLRVCVCLRKHIIPRSADRFLVFLIMKSGILLKGWISPVVMSSAEPSTH